MTYKEAILIVEDLKGRFDAPFGSSDKQNIERLYTEVLRKRFVPTSCQQCYHDALIEIYVKLKKDKKMAKVCNYRLKAGFIISCPDFYNGKIFTNENLTDKVAKEYLAKYPKMEDYFQKIPPEDLIENKTLDGGDGADGGSGDGGDGHTAGDGADGGKKGGKKQNTPDDGDDE